MNSIQVSDLMDATPLTVTPGIGVIVAMRKLLGKGVSAVAVVDEKGSLLGVLSEADCMRGTLMGGYFEQVGELVSQRMTTDVCSVSPDTDLVSAAELMLNNKRRMLPVTKDGKVVGALSRTAVISAIIEQMDSSVAKAS